FKTGQVTVGKELFGSHVRIEKGKLNGPQVPEDPGKKEGAVVGEFDHIQTPPVVGKQEARMKSLSPKQVVPSHLHFEIFHVKFSVEIVDKGLVLVALIATAQGQLKTRVHQKGKIIGGPDPMIRLQGKIVTIHQSATLTIVEEGVDDRI